MAQQSHLLGTCPRELVNVHKENNTRIFISLLFVNLEFGAQLTVSKEINELTLTNT